MAGSPLDLTELLGEDERCCGGGSGGVRCMKPLRGAWKPFVSPEDRPDTPADAGPCAIRPFSLLAQRAIRHQIETDLQWRARNMSMQPAS